jgi:preprotein translocase subunit SecD
LKDIKQKILPYVHEFTKNYEKKESDSTQIFKEYFSMNSTVRRLVSSELMIWLLVGAIGMYCMYPLRKSLRFGIDLVGGTYLTLEVQTDKAVEAELLNKLQKIGSLLKQHRSITVISKNITDQKIILTFESQQQAQEAHRLLKKEVADIEQSVQKNSITCSFPEHVEKRIKIDAVSRNIAVLHTRLDRFSVAEILILPQGEKNIIVELPDVADPQEAKDAIGRAALLEFKIVEKIGTSEKELLLEYDGDLPDELQIVPGERENGRNLYYVVQRFAKVTGNMLTDARPSIGGRSGADPVVLFSFNDEGAQKFYDLTSKNINRQLAIVLDDEVISAPRVESAIRGSGTITGSFSSSETKQLSYLLKSGSFAAPVTFEEERNRYAMACYRVWAAF